MIEKITTKYSIDSISESKHGKLHDVHKAYSDIKVAFERIGVEIELHKHKILNFDPIMTTYLFPTYQPSILAKVKAHLHDSYYSWVRVSFEHFGTNGLPGDLEAILIENGFEKVMH